MLLKRERTLESVARNYLYLIESYRELKQDYKQLQKDNDNLQEQIDDLKNLNDVKDTKIASLKEDSYIEKEIDNRVTTVNADGKEDFRGTCCSVGDKAVNISITGVREIFEKEYKDRYETVQEDYDRLERESEAEIEKLKDAIVMMTTKAEQAALEASHNIKF